MPGPAGTKVGPVSPYVTGEFGAGVAVTIGIVGGRYDGGDSISRNSRIDDRAIAQFTI